MNTFDLSRDVPPKAHIHMIGIGGISMSGLAEYLQKNGFSVTGSDTSASPLTEKLEEMGVRVFIGHNASNVGDAALVVYTAAIKKENPERIEAFRRNIPSIERSVLLGAVMRHFEKAVAVAGTHGKTSTTGMLASILMQADTDPTISIGGELTGIRNFRLGHSAYFVTEACEYHRSFLEFFPQIAVILNVELDHLDYYRDIEDIKSAFRDFAALVPDDGAVLVCADSPNALASVASLEKPIVTFAVAHEADFTAKHLVSDEKARYCFDIYYKEEFLSHICLQASGETMVIDALAAYAAAHLLGVPKESIEAGLEAFAGVKRRMEKKGEVGGILVYDDYAHHPTEIASTIKTLKTMAKKDIYLVFQPHTYTRTHDLFDGFVKVLSDPALHVILVDIYAAREKDTGFISSRDLSDNIANSVYMGSFQKAKAYLSEHAESGDIVITVGAGDVWKIGEELLS